ncbi:protein-L-isoaspartate(D-aspartate) O-methyltransferase [Geomonas sp. RF6]|uniref:protein-L-isoaspartate(D-aspartate) O-methyltransferase n=1 Tax=Geomonas sp. RF6 TaxID=2897342 RepID=UPI001E53A447|nr:protein-L-isoaspartate(D-aspartate) O-methyltransferase [Geomonas sp. RF6]UFS69059.1 protein-L-isoaspartate(D-aspartate) O-methyltransferase [Geomonas sp. RF6]
MFQKRDLSAKKELMIVQHLVARGIRDEAVLRAMREVPREAFVAEGMEAFAYEDSPLPIQEGQTISQPYIVAFMTEALELSPSDRVLEIGTGSGYAAAILSRVVGEVHTVERIGFLAQQAAVRLREHHFDNVIVHEGDGTLGWPEAAPYDAVVVTAGAPEVPESLMRQLALNGRLVIPVGDAQHYQTLVRVRRETETRFLREELCAVRFVPLIGREGW